jgi:hypothetical protein
MPFQPGNQEYSKRKVDGRPTDAEVRIRQEIIARYWKEAKKREDKLIKRYFAAKDAPRDVINRLIPYAKNLEDQPKPAVSIQIAGYINTVQLQPEGLPAPVLVCDAEEEQSGTVLAPAKRQGQDVSKLHTQPYARRNGR